jgi:hypothetical protein
MFQSALNAHQDRPGEGIQVYGGLGGGPRVMLIQRREAEGNYALYAHGADELHSGSSEETERCGSATTISRP